MSALGERIVRIIVLCIASVGVLQGVADAQVPACAENVHTIYKKMAGEVRAPGSVSRIRYTVKTTATWHGKTQTVTSNVELIASDSRLYLSSEQMELGQDATTAVVVLPSRKTIHISGSNLEKFRQIQGSSIIAMRDSLFSTSDVTECTSRTDNVQGADQKVTFHLKPGPRSRLKMEFITFYLNTAKQTIQRIVFTPTTDNTMKLIDVTFNSVEYNYATDRFSRPLLTQFIDDNGRPIQKYKGYLVSDARKSSR